jgi:sigma-B regulation protein RsbU (phosphoserine phosphatase)
VQQETRDTYRFFTREIDFDALRPRPWYERYPIAVWKVFQAMAYRLNPARRLLFAAAVPMALLGWWGYLMASLANGWLAHPMFLWVLIAATLLFALLILELKDKLTLKGDLEIARQIQFGLLPFAPYSQDGVAIRAAMRPANTVGGDYFDLIELGERRLGIVIGDVAGKGMPAALLMALLQGSLRTLLTAGLRGPDLIAKLNGHLHANIPSNRLVTLFYAEMDLATGEVRYVNGGHNPPFLLRADGGLERLPATAVALGIVPNLEPEELRLTLAHGDRLFLYTDGITEAFNAADEEFGEERLEALLDLSRGEAAPGLIEAVQGGVLRFCAGEPPRDDMTLMVIDRT